MTSGRGGNQRIDRPYMSEPRSLISDRVKRRMEPRCLQHGLAASGSRAPGSAWTFANGRVGKLLTVGAVTGKGFVDVGSHLPGGVSP
jgi:hypothetical protein